MTARRNARGRATILALAALLVAAPNAVAGPPGGEPPGHVDGGDPADRMVPVPAIEPVVAPGLEPDAPVGIPTHMRSGAEIYAAFRDGLSEPGCPAGASPRWSRHFSAAPTRLAERDETLALFGYVVDALREAHLPTEYALIPFVESGYKADARSQLGPTGLWQFIAMTARNHKVPIRDGYDGRLSAVDSTRAAVRYLKTLHGMFAGDWRLASMAYNAGEYRLLGALRRSGQVARSADPDKLGGLSGITRAYPRKMHAIACLLQQADDDAAWMAALDRPVERLVAAPLPKGTSELDAWSRDQGIDPARVRRLNPAFRNGHVMRLGSEPMQVLAPAVPVVERVETSPATSSADLRTSVPTPPARTRPR